MSAIRFLGSFGFFELLLIFQIIIFLVGFIFFYFKSVNIDNRTKSVWIGWSIVLFSCSEMWVFGPYSYAFFLDQNALALHKFLFEYSGAERHSFAYGGGTDIAAMFHMTGQLLSLERLLLGFLPLSLAVLFHKILVSGIAYLGTYIVCRRVGHVDRIIAVGFAFLFILSHQRLVNITWFHGVGFALVPMAVYLIIGRMGRRYYWYGVAGIAFLNAISSTPTHSNLSLFAAIILASFVQDPKILLRSVPAQFVILVCVLLNWHESLLAKTLFAPHSYRGLEISYAKFGGLTQLGVPNVSGFNSIGSYYFIGAVIIIISIWRLSIWRSTRIALALLAAIFTGSILEFVPWSAIGLGFLSGVQFTNIFPAYYTIVSLTAAIIIQQLTLPYKSNLQPIWTNKTSIHRLIMISVLAAGLSKFAWSKAYNSSVWLSEGGLQNYVKSVEAVKKLRHQHQLPTRFLTVPYRVPVIAAAAAGRDTLDGMYGLQAMGTAKFWRNANDINRLEGSYVHMIFPESAYKCCANLDIGLYYSMKAMALANVGYVISVLPLKSNEMTLVSHPPEPTVLPRRSWAIRKKIKGYIKYLFETPEPYIYSLNDPMPRLFSAKRVIKISDKVTESQRFALVTSQNSREHIAYIFDDATLPDGIGVARLITAKYLIDTIKINTHAPKGGLLVVSTPHLPFWKAHDQNGADLRVFPVNMFQMGIYIPPNTKQIDLNYKRNSLRNLLNFPNS